MADGREFAINNGWVRGSRISGIFRFRMSRLPFLTPKKISVTLMRWMMKPLELLGGLNQEAKVIIMLIISCSC